MKNKYGIGFFAVTIIAVLMITCAYQFTFQKAKERVQAEQKTEEEERKEKLCKSSYVFQHRDSKSPELPRTETVHKTWSSQERSRFRSADSSFEKRCV